jgi:Flp pilus assembly protein TadG
MMAVEMALALPVLALLLIGSIQYGAFFFLKGMMGDTAREAARGMATGALTEAQAVTQVQSGLANWGNAFVVMASLPGGVSPDSAVVEITVPMADIAFVNYMDLFSSGNLSTRVAMWSEL